jgi:hypothetical protein
MQTVTLYMYLLEEGSDCWRPVQAEPLGNELFRVLGPMSDDEVWEFPPDSIVATRRKSFSSGSLGLVAIAPS